MECTEHSAEEADDLFDEAIEFSKRSDEVKASEILAHLLEAHTSTIEEYSIRVHLGTSYYYLDRYSDSIDTLEPAVKQIDPSDDAISYVHALRYLASSYHLLEMYVRASVCYKRAEEHIAAYDSPDRRCDKYLFYLGKGRTSLFLGHFKDAANDFLRAEVAARGIEDDDDDRLRRRNLLDYEIGRVYVYARMYDIGAERLLKVDSRILPDGCAPGFHFAAMKLAIGAGDWEEAWSAYQDYVNTGVPMEELAEAYYYEGVIQSKRGNDEEARTSFGRCLKVETESSWVHEEARRRLGDPNPGAST